MSKSKSDRLAWVPGATGVLLVILTGIGIYLEYRPEEGHATVQVLSTEQLTPSLEIPGLTSQFTYFGDTIQSLWKSRIHLVNDGEVTLIGEGEQQNVIGGEISLAFDSLVNALGISPESSSFPHELRLTSFDSAILDFVQWRPNESATYSVYFETDSTVDSLPLPSIPVRAIVDGEIAVRRIEPASEITSRSWAAKLPDPIAAIGRIVGIGITAVACLVIISVFIIVNITQQIRLHLWRRNYKTEFVEYIDKLVDDEELLDTDEVPSFHPAEIYDDYMRQAEVHRLLDVPRPWFRTRKEVLEKPWLLPSDKWDDFSGEPIPVRSPVSSGPVAALGTFALGLALLLGFIALGLSALPLT